MKSWVLLTCLIYSFYLSSQECFLFSDAIKRAHEAMWDTFVPFDQDEKDSTITALLAQAKEEAWHKIKENSQLKAALLLMANIYSLHDSLLINIYYLFMEKDEETRVNITGQKLSKIKDFIHELKRSNIFLSLSELKKQERLELLSIMLSSDINFIRRMAFYLRLFYLNSIYNSSLGTVISQIKPHGGEVADIIPPLPQFFTNLKYNENEETIEGEIDALFVGSGASASVAAHQLQKAGLKVLVVEKGPFVIPGAINTTDNFNFLDEKGLRMSENGSLILLNANVAGGGPTVNIDLSFAPTLPYIKYRFDDWHKKQIIPKFLWTHRQISDAYLWVEKIFSPRKVSPEELNQNNAILTKGAKALGIDSKWFSLNTYEPGTSPHKVTSKKSSLEKLLVKSMMDKKNPLTLLTSCAVKKVIIKKNRAQGIVCKYHPQERALGLINDLYGFNIKENTKIKIKAKSVIMAAGNLGTSSILLRSKINNPNIGKGFVVHPFVPIAGLFKDPINANVGLSSSVFIDEFLPTKENPQAPGYIIESAGGQPSLGALLLPGAPRQILDRMKNLQYMGGLGVILADTPQKENHIEIDKKGQPKIYYNLSQNDKDRFILGIKTAIKILFAAGATDVFFHSYEKPFFMYDNVIANTIKPDMDLDETFKDFSFLPNKNLLMGAHMMGSNKMGMDKENSVVNPDYEVWGVKDLYVIDASIFPTTVGANPMQTIYTVAKIFADKFIEKYVD